jgi:hypothetical protein
MKSVSIIAIGVFALIALCSSVPVVDQQIEAQARLDIYNDFLAGLFSGLVGTTLGSASNFLNQLINENVLNVGKRDVDQARAGIFTFLYDNILQDFFSGLVTNTFGHVTNTLNGLISTNPLGLGKRNVEGDLAARVDILSFLYDNILQDFFSGLVSNTFGHLTNTLNGLITTNPLGLGKRSVSIQQVQETIAQTLTTLIEKFKGFAHQAVAAASINQQKLAELIKANIADIKAIVANLAKQLSTLIPSTIVDQVSHALAALQSVLIFWTSGLGGSLGPVIGPFHS